MDQQSVLGTYTQLGLPVKGDELAINDGSLSQIGSKAWGVRVDVEEENKSNPNDAKMRLGREVSCVVGTVGASSSGSSINYGGNGSTEMGAYGVHSPKKNGSNVNLLNLFGNTTDKGDIQFGSFT
ncbi:hypothetical protein FRX31_007702, partial [Thalictrum thalictroides]